MAVLAMTWARLTRSCKMSCTRRLSEHSFKRSTPSIRHASSSAQRPSTDIEADSGRPRRTMFTPCLSTPSTMLSMAMLESEAANVPPSPDVRAHCCKMRTATVVFPVPGGPWTSTRHFEIAASIARCWLSFMPSAARPSSRASAATRDSAATWQSRPLPRTAWMTNGDGRFLGFLDFASCTVCRAGDDNKLTAMTTREYCWRLASLSTRNLPCSWYTGRGGVLEENLMTKGFSSITSASSMPGGHTQEPSEHTPTESPFCKPRRSESVEPTNLSTFISLDFSPFTKFTLISVKPA
mmetsp:Transcript_108476/g.312482  ORF Transcript_108476/g.312482 Transcript_108476/m.312482 type:complete len:295 (+) Transcript_108476:1258-2142(+)